MRDKTFNIAIVGGGVAGVTAAHILQRSHQVTLFEKNDYIGGHTNTVEIADGPDAGTAVDTGFIVCNDRTYPLFYQFLDQLGVSRQLSDMSFGFYDASDGFYYAGTNVSGMFAQPRNLISPRFWSMLYEIARFGRVGLAALERGEEDHKTLGEFLADHGFSKRVIERYIIPMGAAIWSTAPQRMMDFPAKALLSFYRNHGLLKLTDIPAWRTVAGGSWSYIKAFLKTFKGRVVKQAKIDSIRRSGDGVFMRVNGGEERFDKVVLAAHADQSLALLADPSPDETRLLGAWRYEENHTVLHTDASIMPPSRRAWASWNYVREKGRSSDAPATLTYYMNRLQNLNTTRDYFVTLNREGAYRDVDVIREFTYTHPGYTFDSIAAQRELPRLNGVNKTYYCGSYFGNGFHEDAVRSSVQMARGFGLEL